jgi:hypothetical protein
MNETAIDPSAYSEAQRAWLRRVWFDYTDRPMPEWLTATTPGSVATEPEEVALDAAIIPVLAA